MESPSYNERVRKTKNKCTSGSVVEHRLAKARAAGSNPVSCFFLLPEIPCKFEGFRAFVCLESCRHTVDSMLFSLYFPFSCVMGVNITGSIYRKEL